MDITLDYVNRKRQMFDRRPLTQKEFDAMFYKFFRNFSDISIRDEKISTRLDGLTAMVLAA